MVLKVIKTLYMLILLCCVIFIISNWTGYHGLCYTSLAWLTGWYQVEQDTTAFVTPVWRYWLGDIKLNRIPRPLLHQLCGIIDWVISSWNRIPRPLLHQFGIIDWVISSWTGYHGLCYTSCVTLLTGWYQVEQDTTASVTPVWHYWLGDIKLNRIPRPLLHQLWGIIDWVISSWNRIPRPLLHQFGVIDGLISSWTGYHGLCYTSCGALLTGWYQVGTGYHGLCYTSLALLTGWYQVEQDTTAFVTPVWHYWLGDIKLEQDTTASVTPVVWHYWLGDIKLNRIPRPLLHQFGIIDGLISSWTGYHDLCYTSCVTLLTGWYQVEQDTTAFVTPIWHYWRANIKLNRIPRPLLHQFGIIDWVISSWTGYHGLCYTSLALLTGWYQVEQDTTAFVTPVWHYWLGDIKLNRIPRPLLHQFDIIDWVISSWTGYHGLCYTSCVALLTGWYQVEQDTTAFVTPVWHYWRANIKLNRIPRPLLHQFDIIDWVISSWTGYHSLCYTSLALLTGWYQVEQDTTAFVTPVWHYWRANIKLNRIPRPLLHQFGIIDWVISSWTGYHGLCYTSLALLTGWYQVGQDTTAFVTPVWHYWLGDIKLEQNTTASVTPVWRYWRADIKLNRIPRPLLHQLWGIIDWVISSWNRIPRPLLHQFGVIDGLISSWTGYHGLCYTSCGALLTGWYQVEQDTTASVTPVVWHYWLGDIKLNRIPRPLLHQFGIIDWVISSWTGYHGLCYTSLALLTGWYQVGQDTTAFVTPVWHYWLGDIKLDRIPRPLLHQFGIIDWVISSWTGYHGLCYTSLALLTGWFQVGTGYHGLFYTSLALLTG